MVSNVARGRAPFASYYTVPRPLTRFDTHSQSRLGTFETKITAHKGRCAIPRILEKTGGCQESRFYLLTSLCDET